METKEEKKTMDGLITREQFEEIAEKICDKYCRYPEIWDEESDGELSESEVCRNCPLSIFDRQEQTK